jgi:RNA polymerase sigma-70 factor (ECF subfamily)
MEPDAYRALLVRALQRVASRDADALKYVYRHTSAKLMGVCLRILRDKDEAEDVLQEVYLTVWRKAEAFDPDRASPITWMVRIARNRAIDRLRALSGLQYAPIESAADLEDTSSSAFASVSERQEAERLRACLDAIEPSRADAVRTAFFEGLTYEDLAKKVGVPLGTMKSWIRRSLISLRGCLEA